MSIILEQLETRNYTMESPGSNLATRAIPSAWLEKVKRGSNIFRVPQANKLFSYRFKMTE